MNKWNLVGKLFVGLWIMLTMSLAEAATPLWTFAPVPGFPPSIVIAPNDTAIIQYTVTNQSLSFHVLGMQPIQGISASGCLIPLGYHQSCTLTLTVTGSALAGSVHGGPELCQINASGALNPNQCYRPSQDNILNITLLPSNQFIITPSAGTGGSISPNTPQTVTSGANSPIFTATPDTGFGVSGWMLDGLPFATCGRNTTCQVTNVTANHTLAVNFISGVFSAAGGFYQFPAAFSIDEGNWSLASAATLGTNVFNSTSCTDTGNTAICIAAGQNTTTGRPVLYVSKNGGSSWTQVPTTSQQGIFYTTSCTGPVGSVVCTVGGSYGTANGSIAVPLLYVSRDGNASIWSPVTVTGISEAITTTNCSGTGGTALCLAGGDFSGIINRSVDGGATWSQVTVSATASIVGLACTGTGGTAICSAVGDDSNVPTIYSSTDGGATWTLKVSAPGGQGHFLSTSCTGTGSTAICTAAGGEVTGNALLYVTTNGGSTWAPAVTRTGGFFYTSCAGTGASAICIANGTDITATVGILYQSTNGGVNWSQVTIQNTAFAFQNSNLTTSCAGSGSTAICTSVGQDVASQRPVIYQTTNGGGSWSQIFPLPISTTGFFASTSCTGSGSTGACTSVGALPTNSPLLFVSPDAGMNWNNIPIIPNTEVLTSTSCTGTAATTMCTAAGQNAVLYQSTNAGLSWSPVTGTSGNFNWTNCTGTGPTAICTAVGQSTTTPELFLSTNGGTSWNSIPTSTDQGIFYSSSCTGTGSTAICIATGVDNINQQFLLYQSTDGGSNWIPIPFGLKGVLNSTSCTGTGSTAICTAVGQNSTNNAPQIFASLDGGSSWSGLLMTLIHGSLNSTSCTGTGSTAICTAAGVDTTTNTPLLYQSTDGGVTWPQVMLPTTDTGVLFSTSCTTTTSTTICAVAGQDTTTNLPLLYISTDGGTTWSPVTTSSNAGAFNSVNCTSIGSTAVCIAGGQDATTGLPLLYFSINGGVTWNPESISTTSQGAVLGVSSS